MSSLRFPVIQTKKTLIQEEDYNFVNKDKKKKTSSNNPLQLIDQLKRKIDEQKKQIENRNITIQGLQRNFQSLSTIVKTQKAQSAALRAELENLKANSQNGDRRATQFHEKCVLLERQNKSLKEELKIVKKTHSQCGQFVALNDQFKRRIVQLQQANQKLHAKLMQTDTDKRVLQIEINKYKGLEKQKRLLNERLVDMEDQIKRLTDVNNGLNYVQATSEAESGRLKYQISIRDKKIEQLKIRQRDQDKHKERLDFEIDFLKKQNLRLMNQLDESEKAMGDKEVYNKIKTQQQQRIRRQYRSLLQQFNNLKVVQLQRKKQSEEKTDMINYAHNQIDTLRKTQQQLQNQFQNKQNGYQHQIEKLMKAIKDLHEQLDFSTGQSSTLNKKLKEEQERNQNHNEKISNLHGDIDQMNRKIQEHQQRYGNYLKLISENQPNVIITNEREMAKLQNNSASTFSKLKGDIAMLQNSIAELQSNKLCQDNNIQTMRKYIKNLQQEVSTKSEELLQKSRLLRSYQQEEEQLNRMVQNQRRLSEKLKAEAERKIKERMQQLQNEKLKSQKEIQEEKERLQRQLQEQKQRNEERLRKQQEKSEKYNKLLQQYKLQEQNLKEMMSKEQQQLSRFSQQKQQQIKQMIQQRQQQLEREKKNNKLLWSDNKKLKDLQNKLKQDSKKMLQEKQAAKRQEIQKLKRQLQRKYRDEMSSVQSQQSNSSELKKILNQRTTQFKEITEKYNKLKGQSEFYKNRNKELQALVSRVQKQFKDKITELERQSKSSKQVVEVLEKKLKQAEQTIAQSQKKNKRQLKYLYDEIEQMKRKAKNERVQEKISLVNKSMGDLDISLKTLMNTMSCNYCVQVVKQCVRLQCGHIYCKKCKGGYEPNCGECKKKSNPSSDRIIDDSVSKAQYMLILINTIKDDLSKISL